jgi:two-component system sensor histidine kinase/response regulator
MDTPSRILVVEDDPVNLLVITRMLRRLGHEADIANNGREAVEAAGRAQYDIIFMDLMMPELDGIQAAKQIRERQSGDGPMIFAVTANVMPEDRAAALAAGMDDYVTKPIRMEIIRELVLTAARENTAREDPARQKSASPDFLNVQTFDELREVMDDADFFAELVQEFIKNSDELVVDMTTGLAAQDWEAISRAAHILKSTSAAFGGMSLTESAVTAEDAVRNDATDQLPDILANLRHERDRLCTLLEASV